MKREETIAAWRRYGVAIEQEADGTWRWAETDDTPERVVNGVFSPPFSTFERCVSDLEHSFGPLEDAR